MGRPISTSRITGYFFIEFILDRFGSYDDKRFNQLINTFINEITIDFFKREIKIIFVRPHVSSIVDMLYNLGNGFKIGYYLYKPCSNFTHDNYIRGYIFNTIKITSYIETESVDRNVTGTGIATFEFQTFETSEKKFYSE